MPPEAFDLEYRSGRWDHFFGFEQLPRNLVLAGAIHHSFPTAPAVPELAGIEEILRDAVAFRGLVAVVAVNGHRRQRPVNICAADRR